MVGIYYFICIPFSIIALNMGYSIKFGVEGAWGTIDLNEAEFIFPFLFIFISLILLCITFLALTLTSRKHYLLEEKLHGFNLSYLKRMLTMSCFATFVGWLLAIYAAGGLLPYFVTYWYSRTEPLRVLLGDSIATFYTYFLLANQAFLIAAGALYFVKKIAHCGKITMDRMTTLILIAMIGDLILTGNRFNIAILGIILISSIYQFKIRRYLMALIILVPMAILFFSVWPSLRGNLTDIEKGLENNTVRFEVEDTRLVPIMDAVEGSAVVLLFQVIKSYGESIDYLYGSSYLRTFRNVSGWQSENFSIVLAKEFIGEDEETSLTSTLMGEGYANFGLFSILLLPLGTIIFYMSSFCRRCTIFSQMVIFVLIISAMRYYFSVMIIIALILLCVYYFYSIVARLRLPYLIPRVGKSEWAKKRGGWVK